ncbi:MAG: hypothetical protein R3245_06715, partial [Kiloniellales bacterium]|nr:hypothetical protein [Kiloniellales bacterium]
AVISGASSTPALSHAALDSLVEGWRQVNSIRVAISPGNRAPRGPSVVRAVLSYAGRPVRHFSAGRWRTAPGWSQSCRMAFPGIGPRRVSLCETPDLDLLVERFRPKESAIFLAGLELGLLHRGLELTALPVRLGLLHSLLPFAHPLHKIASLFERIGSDKGGMIVEAAGLDGEGEPVRARWSLCAKAGRGPYVPTLPALAMIRHFRDGKIAYRGAKACTGFLTLTDLAGDFHRLGIVTQSTPFPAIASGSAGSETKTPVEPYRTRQRQAPCSRP